MFSNDIKVGSRGPISPAVGRIRVPVAVPDPPSWLGEAARLEWDRVTAILGAADLLTKLDQSILAAYCQAVVEHQEATKMLEEEGRVVAITVKGADRLRAHPAINLQRSAWKAIEAFGKLLGLDPSSRGRLAATQPPPAREGVLTRKR